jgi:thiazole synthase
VDTTATTPLTIGPLTLRSRLILGTGKYTTFEIMRAAHEASGVDMVTVAIRRVDLSGEGANLLDFIDTERIHLLPNTAGCFNAEDAIRTAHLAREACNTDFIKLEVIGCKKTLMPDNEATLAAAKVLVADGFVVLPYVTDDIVLAQKLEQAGCAAVMPLGAPIGSGLGIRNPHTISLIKEAVQVPVIVDAGVGTASDAAIAFELGCDGVLLNTAVAGAGDPVRMARAMRLSCEAGRLAFESGRIPRRRYATASSPTEGLVSPLATAAS